MKKLFITALVLFTLAGPMLGQASADWDWGGGSGTGDYGWDDSGAYCYFGFC